MNIAKLPPLARNGLNATIVIGSAGLCLLLLPTRWPGMEILGIGPSWLVMWTIAWSLHRSIWSAAGASIILGLIQDSMTFPMTATLGTIPTHVLSLTIVAVLTVMLSKRRYLDDRILSVSIGTCLLTLVSESIMAGQYLLQTLFVPSSFTSLDNWSYLLNDRFTVIPIAALLSGLWMPILYYPLQLWWRKWLQQLN